MEDKKYTYTIQWKQSYNTWPSQEWIDKAVDTIVESNLENSDYADAKSVIDRIKNL